MCFPYSSFQQVRQPSIPPKLKKAKSNFFTNRNILRTLKKEPLNIMLLHTSRTVWCLGRVPKHWNQWQEVEGLLFSPQNSQLVHILSFHSKAVVSLFIFPTGPTALDSEPRGRRYVKNMIYNRKHLYSRAIHCPASMEMHYVQWFLHKSM